MAVSRGKQYVRPVIVEVRPSDLAPASPSSPKAVRFAENSSSPVSGISRELSPTEAWSLYHFETHARKCSECYDPYDVYRNKGRLCADGNDLAQDVALHVYYKSGEIYSYVKDDDRLVRAELPPGYNHVRGLLKGIDYATRSTARAAPVISYDRGHPVMPRRSDSSERRAEPVPQRKEVIIEPHNSEKEKHQRSTGKSKPKERGYKTQVVQEHKSEARTSREATREKPRETPREPAREPAKTTERRGSLYESDRNRKETQYYVEIREPDSERKKKERRRSGIHA